MPPLADSRAVQPEFSTLEAPSASDKVISIELNDATVCFRA
jgi:hypothetical protein